MKISRVGSVAEVSLSRKNLTDLLAMLDDPKHSSKALVRYDKESATMLYVKAEEDETHYVERPAGRGYTPRS